MDITWLAPVVLILIASLVAAVLAHRLVSAADELSSSLRRFRRLDQALVPVRVETRRARASIDRLPRR